MVQNPNQETTETSSNPHHCSPGFELTYVVYSQIPSAAALVVRASALGLGLRNHCKATHTDIQYGCGKLKNNTFM